MTALAWNRAPVRVRVPATSANLGPGFDALGLALAWYDEVEARVTGSGLSIEVSGEGADAAAAGERHLVVRAMRAAFALAGGQPPGLALRCVNAIPQGRGLGSSAGAVVAGLLAARALAGGAAAGQPVAGEPAPGQPAPAGDHAVQAGHAAARAGGPGLVDDALFALAARLEGHPDNAAACLTGGLTIAWTPGRPVVASGAKLAAGGGGGPRAVRLDPLPAIRPVVCVPAASLATTAARRALPAAVPHQDAAASAGRSALLVAALTSRPDLLFDATEDLLHEPYRRPLMPASADLIGRLRAAGIAAVLSGAGPSVLALTAGGRPPGPEEVDSIAGQMGSEWHVRPLHVDRQGATIRSALPGAGTRRDARHGQPGHHADVAPACQQARPSPGRGCARGKHRQL